MNPRDLVVAALISLVPSGVAAAPKVAARGPAEPLPPAVDIAGVRTDLRLFSDGKGHYVALIVKAHDDGDEYVFYGDGKTFWQQRVYSSSRDGDTRLDFGFWEPRGKRNASVAWKANQVTVYCDSRETILAPVPAREADAMLGTAKFHAPRWGWRAYALARDDRGRYYYVDRAREPEDSRRFRLWVGQRGDMKLQQMKNVVSDSEGDIFTAKSGELRLILDRGEAVWVKGKTRTTLKYVPVEDNVALIYNELGAYVGLPLGTPCDDL